MPDGRMFGMIHGDAGNAERAWRCRKMPGDDGDAGRCLEMPRDAGRARMLRLGKAVRE